MSRSHPCYPRGYCVGQSQHTRATKEFSYVRSSMRMGFMISVLTVGPYQARMYLLKSTFKTSADRVQAAAAEIRACATGHPWQGLALRAIRLRSSRKRIAHTSRPHEKGHKRRKGSCQDSAEVVAGKLWRDPGPQAASRATRDCAVAPSPTRMHSPPKRQ
jgi:hypothetical protein